MIDPPSVLSVCHAPQMLLWMGKRSSEVCRAHGGSISPRLRLSLKGPGGRTHQLGESGKRRSASARQRAPAMLIVMRIHGLQSRSQAHTPHQGVDECPLPPLPTSGRPEGRLAFNHTLNCTLTSRARQACVLMRGPWWVDRGRAGFSGTRVVVEGSGPQDGIRLFGRNLEPDREYHSGRSESTDSGHIPPTRLGYESGLRFATTFMSNL